MLDITVLLPSYMRWLEYWVFLVSRTIFAAVLLIGFASSKAVANKDRNEEKIAFGEYLSGECVTCHLISGTSKGIPSIVGLEIKTFVSVMHAYKARKLDNKVMTTIASALSDEEIEALAIYFASVKPR